MRTSSNTLKQVFGIMAIGIVVISAPSCTKKIVKKAPEHISRDQVYQTVLNNVRLKDGVPLDIALSVRWNINNYTLFSEQFESPDKYDSLILAPRQLELANDISNHYGNVDTLFSSLRHQFISELKEYLADNLGEEGVTIKEVIVSDIIFPQTYTSGKEKIALKEQELESIRKQAVINNEQAIANTEQAKSNGQVQMAQAEADAKVQKIKAETEKSIRMSRLAKAETEKQVAKLEAQSKAEERVLLAEADLQTKKNLNELNMNNQREINDIEVTKKKDLDDVALLAKKKDKEMTFEQDMRMAQLCSENPTYASYMVNKELASKVQIAVLPNNQDGSVFKNLLNNGMAAK